MSWWILAIFFANKNLGYFLFPAFFLINHRAKRGGSLFQGGSGGTERGHEATPPLGGATPPHLVAKQPPRSRSDPSIAGGFASVRRFKPRKLCCLLTDLDEIRREGTFGQAAQNSFVVFWFGHQGAELLSVKGGKIGVLAVFEGF